mgnify:CR=1 FL=1
MSGKVFGSRVKRIEDPKFLRGTAHYIDDIRLKGALHASFVRSPFAHAKIGEIDASAALALDGVHVIAPGIGVRVRAARRNARPFRPGGSKIAVIGA